MNDGGPAFPSKTTLLVREEILNDPLLKDKVKAIDTQIKGMSLRDWFAGMALIELIRNVHEAVVNGAEVEPTLIELTAQAAYEYADAMLAERERKK